jgi:hypothetical protein
MAEYTWGRPALGFANAIGEGRQTFGQMSRLKAIGLSPSATLSTPSRDLDRSGTFSGFISHNFRIVRHDKLHPHV